MTRLDGWLQQATRRLALESAAQVRSEIREHYESARETAMSGGANAEEADRAAVLALGDPGTANRQYRSVLLTAGEARALGASKWEAQAVCARPWLKWLFLTVFAAALPASAVSFYAGALGEARILLAAGLGIGLLVAATLLPVYTRGRARIFRCVKWVVLPAMLVLAFGPDSLKYSWLLASCLWTLVWTEWTRASIRRKLRVEDWPRHLYL